MEFTVGKKVKIKTSKQTRRAKVLEVYPTYILFQTKNYKTCFLKTDFKDGTAKIVR